MDSISLRVSDLKKLVDELLKAKIDYVELMFFEAEGDGDDFDPAHMSVTGVRASEQSIGYDFDDLEAVPESEFDPYEATVRTNITD